MYNIKSSNQVNRTPSSFNKASVTKVYNGYFDKIKYYPYLQTSNLVQNSFLWQKWNQDLNDRRHFYNDLLSDIRSYAISKYNLELQPVERSNASRYGFFYQIDTNVQFSSVKRRRVNFFTYRKFRFNQLRLFYTTCNQRQFKNLYKNYSFIKKRVLDQFLVSLEGRLEFFLQRTQFFPSKYYIKQYLNHHGVLVNGYLVRDKNWILKPWDIVSIPKSQHVKLFRSLKSRLSIVKANKLPIFNSSASKKSFFKKMTSLNISPLFSVNFLMPIPRYIEVDYVLLEAMFIRNPSVDEVILPFNSEVDVSNRSYYK